MTHPGFFFIVLLVVIYQTFFPDYSLAVTEKSFDLRPGISQHILQTSNERGQVTVNILEVDLSNKDISLKAALINKKNIKERDSLLNIASFYMAYAGINANYFDTKTGNPLGTLITDGEWLVGPVYNRVAVGFTNENNVLFDQVKLTGKGTVYRGFITKDVFAKFLVSSLNTPQHLYEGIGLFTSIWGNELDISDGKVSVVVKDGFVKSIVKAKAFIPEAGYVLVGDENSILSHLKINDYIEIKWITDPKWVNVKEAVSGGPYLVMDGNVYIDEKVERFDFSKKGKYASRTAIGIGKNGKLYLIVVDGEKRKESSGLTLNELANLLKNIGLKDAINLDGGNSTTMFLDGEIINLPQEKHERKISNSLLIFCK